ncbi:MAG TPA: transglycosylase domain-containing protein [Candidatus Micrarchaeia archaeon]|nr:transglycosylase domain-containing protein [Candidatus Micrarchaeia archaeon]
MAIVEAARPRRPVADPDQRHQRRSPRRPGWRRARRGGAVAVLCVLGLGVASVGATWMATPSTAHILGRVAAIDRAHHGTLLAPAAVPRRLAEALVAVEDTQFYQDHGINLEGLLRAGAYDLVHRCTCQGGSTITQQLIEDVYLRGWDGTLPGRWVDMVLALKAETRLSKRQILAAYLSEVYLGGGAYGAAAASRLYFHRPLRDDTLADVALLAGLPQAPTALDPLLHPAAARERREQVLQAMVAAGDIAPATARAAERRPV